MSETKTTQTGGNGENVSVLMTGAGAPGAWGIIRSLKAADDLPVRIVGVDMDPDAYGFSLVDEYTTVPPGTNTDDYVSQMREIVASHDIDVVLPLTTDELRPLAANRDSIDATVMVSSVDAIDIANDKGELYGFLAANDFGSAPEFHRVDTEDEFVSAVESLGYPEEPVCFKPPVASGMRGFRVLDERSDRLTRLLEEKPGAATTTLDEVLPVLRSGDSFPEFVVMEYLPGQEYSVDLLAMDDSVGPVIPRTRSKTRAGITFQGTVEENQTLIEEASNISKGLGLEYSINIQFKYDADGTPKVIEINPRVAGTIIMCVGAGANLPLLGVKYALGERIPPIDVEWGTWMARYWKEVFRTPDGRTFHVDRESTGPLPRSG